MHPVTRNGCVCGTSALLSAILLGGCGGEVCCGPPPSAPEIAAAAAAARPENVLSVLVTGRARFADSVAVRYGIVGGALDSVTPAEQPADSEVALPVFGLLPETEYELQIIAYGDGTTASSDLLHTTTGSLPRRPAPLCRRRHRAVVRICPVCLG